MFRLMIKEHNKTKLKYLCITKRDNWEGYLGSGLYWLKHLKKHGKDIKTELLYETEDYNDFLEKCLYFSVLFDVVLSEEFANLIPESGYDNQDNLSYTNFEAWWIYASIEMKKDVYTRRSQTLKETWSKTPPTKKKERFDKIGLKLKQNWITLSKEQRDFQMIKLKEGLKIFHENSNSNAYLKWKNDISNGMQKHYANLSEDEYRQISERNRKSRLDLTPDKKEKRKKKIQEVYKSGKHDLFFKKLSEERRGIDNPAAKLISWYGEIYTKTQLIKKLKETWAIIEEELLDENNTECYKIGKNWIKSEQNYEELNCPFCNKKSNPNSKTSSFKRWHFENCKHKPKRK